MSIFEYDYNGHMEVIREEGKEDGYAAGREAGFTDGKKVGFAEGEIRGAERGEALTKKIFKLSIAGKNIKEIAKECGVTEDKVRSILAD